MSKINIDFDIASDLNFLKIYDRSSWGIIEGSPSIIEITSPGFATPKTMYFDKGQVSMYNSISLNGTCVDCFDEELTPLSDGIYVIKVIGSPDTYNKEIKYLKTDEVRMNMDRLYINSINTDSPFKKDFTEKMLELEHLLKGAEANLRWDKEKECGKVFELVINKAEQLKNCKYC